jgi:hypothetical protein
MKIRDNMTPSLVKIQKSIESVPQEAFAVWRANTPIRSGNARRRTRLRGNTIEARYAYAAALDDGASRQAPEGMSEPTEKFLDQKYKNKVRK